jgi:hypothetical protein
MVRVVTLMERKRADFLTVGVKLRGERRAADGNPPLELDKKGVNSSNTQWDIAAQLASLQLS